jgi:hypothetical protein
LAANSVRFGEVMVLTHKQKLVLGFLQFKMDAGSMAIGTYIKEHSHQAKSSKPMMIGSSTANSLAKHGLVGSYGTPKSWFITQKGRDVFR